MKIPDKLKSLTGDFMYSMMGLIVMNGVIQLVLYPFFNRQLGADQFGVVLTLISLVAIMGSTFGTAANYSRMVTSMKEHDSNGDYNIFLCMIAVLSVLVSAAGLLWLKQFSVIVWIGYLALMIFTVLRYYSDVFFILSFDINRISCRNSFVLCYALMDNSNAVRRMPCCLFCNGSRRNI